jgi:hypothetical protein
MKARHLKQRAVNRRMKGSKEALGRHQVGAPEEVQQYTPRASRRVKHLGKVHGVTPRPRADRKPRRAAGGRSENELDSADMIKLARRQAPHNQMKAADTMREALRMRRQGKAVGGKTGM